MKTKIISIVCMFCGFYSVVAQTEYDDMYFTSKDRANQAVALKTEKSQNTLNALTETNAAYQAVLPNSALQGYTGRTINPDYQPNGVAVVSSSYFTPNYQPAQVNSQLYSNNNNNFNNYCNCSQPYSYYGMGGYYSPYSSFGYSPFGYGGYNSMGYSPYSYGGFYSPFSNWGYSPYYGYGSSMAMYYGLGYGFGSAFGYGYGSGFGGYGSYYGGYYPSTVVVVNNPDNHVNTAYGKRQTRSSYTNASANYAPRGIVASNVDPNQNRGGRAASTTNTNSYYQRGWRQDPSIAQSSSSSSGSRFSGYSGGTTNSTRSSWSSGGNSTRSSWGNTNNSGFSNSGFGGATRSSMGSGSSGFSGGGSRSSGFSGGGGSVSHSSGGGRGRGN